MQKPSRFTNGENGSGRHYFRHFHFRHFHFTMPVDRVLKRVVSSPMRSAVDAVRKWKFAAAPEETTQTVQLMFEPQ